MADKTFKAGILGLNPKGLALLEAAERTGRYRIAAVAGLDPETLAAAAQRYEAEPYEDYRQLVVQSELDVLFVAGSMHVCGEHARAALRKGCDVVRVVPPGLDFEQTAELVATARKEKVRFVVADPRRFAPSFADMRAYIQEEGAETFHLISAVMNAPQDFTDPRDRWLTDPQLAGGGVLLHECYALIDQILLNFPVPQQVYSINTNHAPDRQQRLSLTEDTAVVTMWFSDTLLGNLSTSRTFGPWLCRLRAHKDDGYAVVTDERFTIHDNEGRVLEERTYPYDEGRLLAELLERFARHKEHPRRCPLFSAPEEALRTMAVIQAAYVSARTAAAEAPSKILEMARTGPGRLWG